MGVLQHDVPTVGFSIAQLHSLVDMSKGSKFFGQAAKSPAFIGKRYLDDCRVSFAHVGLHLATGSKLVTAKGHGQVQ
jgi:hypothetical protein